MALLTVLLPHSRRADTVGLLAIVADAYVVAGLLSWRAGKLNDRLLLPRPRFTGHSGEQSDHAIAAASANRCSRASAGLR